MLQGINHEKDGVLTRISQDTSSSEVLGSGSQTEMALLLEYGKV